MKNRKLRTSGSEFFMLLIKSALFLSGRYRAASESLKRSEILAAWEGLNLTLTHDIVMSALAGYPDSSKVGKFLDYLHDLNKTFDYAHAKSAVEPVSLVQTAQTGKEYEEASGNPHCDTGPRGPKVVRKVEQKRSSNPFNNMPTITFDMAKLTQDVLMKATSPMGAAQGAAGMVAMTGMMMVKSMVQSAAATAVSIGPPMIPPPVWNNMPLPCVPMVTGANCFGAVLYPITFADSLLADVTDSVMTGMKKQFRVTFLQRAGHQPDRVYQRCFKAYMSLMCSELFPMCTNPQGRDEMIPFIGRVPTCFTSCLAVIAACPGFSFDDIAGPCSEISLPPLCTQAIYLRDDLSRDEMTEDDVTAKLNSKCADYNPQLDAGEDPLLYETEPPEKLFHSQHEVQEMFR
jgi:hypothetical protein